ncbi:MAG: inositol monophosphatase family protein [Cardiobacteriaceae bacterium]|nr:inositol monophosphatase family protein [Cardiobacteriaceae bacterium]
MLVNHLPHKIPALVALSRETSAIILSFYQQSALSIVTKSNDTPLTQADLAAHQHLHQNLPHIINAPVISEEDENKALCPSLYWLIDPIDGTQAFIEQSGEFCICIALIYEHRPILSLIYAPISGKYWYAIQGHGSFVADNYQPPKRLQCRPQKAPLTITAAAHKLSKRMHTLSALLYGEPFHHIPQKSALKFCQIAEAHADLYLKPTNRSSEWDIAAGDLLLQEAGGGLLWIDPQSASLSKPLYGLNTHFTNPPFIAFGSAFSSSQLQQLAHKILELAQ